MTKQMKLWRKKNCRDSRKNYRYKNVEVNGASRVKLEKPELSRNKELALINEIVRDHYTG